MSLISTVEQLNAGNTKVKDGDILQFTEGPINNTKVKVRDVDNGKILFYNTSENIILINEAEVK